MPKWKWEGVNERKLLVLGEMEANSEMEVRRVLRTQGIRVRRIRPPSFLEFDLNQFMVDKGLASAFGPKELGTFTKQLSVLINAGVPILQSLEILYKQERNPTLKITLKRISDAIASGKSLSESMSSQKGFSKLYCNLVKAGEAGGVLDKILVKLAEHLEKQEKIKAQIKSAMMYPSIVVFVGVGVIWGMLAFVVPKFQEMLSSSGQELPELTQMVVDASAFLQKYGLTMIMIIVAVIVALKMYIKTPIGKRMFDGVMMNMPMFGPIIVKANATQFARTLATMLAAGVSLIDALEICSETIDNVIISEDVSQVRKAVSEGKTLVDPMRRMSYFPEMVVQMMKVGEQTGQIDQMMLKVADVFEEEVNTLIGGMTKMIEPIILVVLGGSVAVILGAMYMPIFQAAGGA